MYYCCVTPHKQVGGARILGSGRTNAFAQWWNALKRIAEYLRIDLDDLAAFEHVFFHKESSRISARPPSARPALSPPGPHDTSALLSL